MRNFRNIIVCCFFVFSKTVWPPPTPTPIQFSLKAQSLTVWGDSPDFTLIVCWSTEATIIACCGGVYLCEKYSRTRRRCPRRSLSEVRDRTLVWYAGSSWRTDNSHQHQAGSLDEAWRTNSNQYNRQKHTVIMQKQSNRLNKEKTLFHTWMSSSLSGMAPYCLLICSRIRLPRRWYHSWVCW